MVEGRIGLMWFLRMQRWARNPPSWTQVKVFMAILALCLVLASVELIWGWPEALTTQGGARPVR